MLRTGLRSLYKLEGRVMENQTIRLTSKVGFLPKALLVRQLTFFFLCRGCFKS